MNFRERISFQWKVLEDPASAFSPLNQNHVDRISKLHITDEQVLLETLGLFSPYRAYFPFQGIALAYSIRLYASSLFFDIIILNSVYVDKSSSEALSDTLQHEIHHLNEARNACLADHFDPSLKKALVEDEMKFQQKFPSKAEVRKEDAMFLLDFAPVLPAIPLYYIGLGAFLFVTKNVDRLRKKGVPPIDGREQLRGEESTRVRLAARKEADELYEQILMFLSQHQEDIEGFPFGDLIVRPLEYLKSMPRGEWFKKRKQLAAYVKKMREELSRYRNV
jgi:hypothetical protein